MGAGQEGTGRCLRPVARYSDA